MNMALSLPGWKLLLPWRGVREARTQRRQRNWQSYVKLKVTFLAYSCEHPTIVLFCVVGGSGCLSYVPEAQGVDDSELGMRFKNGCFERSIQ